MVSSEIDAIVEEVQHCRRRRAAIVTTAEEHDADRNELHLLNVTTVQQSKGSATTTQLVRPSTAADCCYIVATMDGVDDGAIHRIGQAAVIQHKPPTLGRVVSPTAVEAAVTIRCLSDRRHQRRRRDAVVVLTGTQPLVNDDGQGSHFARGMVMGYSTVATDATSGRDDDAFAIRIVRGDMLGHARAVAVAEGY